MATKLPDLGKMVGPLPLGAWVAIVGGGFLFMTYTRKQNDVAPSDTGTLSPEDTTSPDNVGSGASGNWVDVTPPDSNSGQTTIDTNEAWGVAAVNWLIAQGYDPAVSDSAIRKYLAGGEGGYSSQEFALVTFALGHLGSPPTPLPPPINGKPPIVHPKPKPVPKPVPKGHKPAPHPIHKPKPPAPKPHVRYYTVRPGDNLSRIGKKYHVSWQSIYNANRHGKRRSDGKMGMISNPNLIHVGWKLIIPN